MLTANELHDLGLHRTAARVQGEATMFVMTTVTISTIAMGIGTLIWWGLTI